MGIRFTPGSGTGNAGLRNRRAAYRQTLADRERVFAKYQSLVGKRYGFANSVAARRAAEQELKNPRLHPEYWDEDNVPRQNMNLNSSCFANIIPAAGGVFLYFRSNPSKGYFYPSAGTTEETAKRVAQLVTSPSMGGAYNGYWGAQNGARKKYSKSGKSVTYTLKGGKSLNLSKFDKMGSALYHRK